MSEAGAMTEEQWLAADSHSDLFRHVRQHQRLIRRVGAKRKFRLLSVAIARHVWDHITEPACRATVELAEQYVDGQATRVELESACRAAEASTEAARLAAAVNTTDPANSHRLATRQMWAIARWATDVGGSLVCTEVVAGAVSLLVGYQTVGTGSAAWHPVVRDALRPFPDLIRCAFGNPFRPVAFAPSWNTSAAVGLATTVYDERSFEKLPILADALQDAACDDPDVLRHLRDEQTHARGCWVLDGLLGRGIVWK